MPSNTFADTLVLASAARTCVVACFVDRAVQTESAEKMSFLFMELLDLLVIWKRFDTMMSAACCDAGVGVASEAACHATTVYCD